MAEVETVGGAVAERADVDRQILFVGDGQQVSQDPAADAAILVVGMKVEMVEAQAFGGDGTEGVESDGGSVANDPAGVLGVERVSEAFAGAGRIEAAEVFKARAHRGDAEIGEGVEVGGGDGGEGQIGFGLRHGHTGLATSGNALARR